MKGAGLILTGLILLGGAAVVVISVRSPGPAEDGGVRPGETRHFSAPRWLAVEMAGEHPSLRWRAVPGALAYTLWRSAEADGTFRVIHMGRDTTFVDREELPRGGTRCYQLTATDWEFGESGFSDSRCVANTR